MIRRLLGSLALVSLTASLIACGAKKDDNKSSGSSSPASGGSAKSSAKPSAAKPTESAKPAEPAASSSPGQAGCITALGDGSNLPPGDLVLKKSCGPVTLSGEVSIDDRTLTIEPGVELRFGPKAMLNIGYSQTAKIVAKGTKDAPILFTSGKDKEPGAWGALRLYDKADRSVLEHVVFEYGGHPESNSDPGSLVLMQSLRTSMKDVSFRSGAGYGLIAIYAESAFEGEITGCDFKGLEKGAMRINPSQLPALGAGNTFDDKAVIAVVDGTVAKPATFRTGATYRLFGELSVARGADDAATPTLKIEPGVTVELVSNASLTIGYSNAGSLQAVGTKDKPVRFTGFDKRKGGWGHIGLYAQSRDTRFENVIVEFAETTESEGAIRCESGAEAAIKDVTFQHLDGFGVSYPDAATNKCKVEGGSADDAKGVEHKPE
ncbi:MAG: hypothetical protein U0271_01280 [Polyangiaceae bacterium]